MKKLFLLTLCLAVCTFTFAQKTVTKTFSGIKSVRLNAASGDIILKKSANSDVIVTVKYSYDDHDYTPLMEQSTSRLTLKEEFSRSNSFSGSSNWTLELPDHVSLNMNTGSGDITIDQLAIEGKSNTGSGNIFLTNVKGGLDFNTGSGDIELNQVDGEIDLNTGSGSIRASGGSGNYSFNAGSGNIRLEALKGDFRINTGSGNIQAKNLALSGSSSFNTGSGSASVVLSGPLDNNISVNSGSGDATLNFNGSPISGEVIMTANKRGGNIVAPFKFDKEEVLADGNSNDRIQKTAKLGNKTIQIKVGTGSGTAEIVK